MVPGPSVSERWRRPWTRSSGLGAILVLIGLVIGGLAYGVARSNEAETIEQAFGETVAEQSAEIEKEILALGEALHSLRALYDSSEEVTRDEFATFAAEPLRRMRAARALAWVPVVDDDARAAHVEQARREGQKDYVVHAPSGDPSPPNRVAFPVYFVAPKGDETLPMGRDLGATAALGAAIARAALSDEPVLSDPVATEGAANPLTLLLLRVLEKEKERVEGFVVLAFFPADLLPDSDPDGEPLPMSLVLRDADASGVEELLGAAGSSGRRSWTRVADLHAATQTWRLEARPTQAYIDARRTWSPALIGIQALGGWLVLVGLAFVVAARGREIALKKRDRTMRNILASLDEGVIVVDAKGRTLFFNEAAERILGRNAEIGVSCAWSSAFGLLQEDSETLLSEDAFPLARALEGDIVPERELFVRSLTGSSEGRWINVSGVPLKSERGNPQGAMIVLRDVSQRKRSQQAIRRLSRAVNHTADAVYIADANGELIYVNRAFETMTGHPRREAVGGSFQAVGLGGGDPEDYVKLRAALLSGSGFRGTTANERRDGTIYYGEQTLTPMLDAKGRLTHWVGVCRDMSEHRRMEEHRIEMELASDVQRKLYPLSAPHMRGFEIAGAVFSAEATCGDYFDFIQLSDSRVAIAVGDVSGHGLGPALVMTHVRACLRAYMQMTDDLGEIFERINLVLHEDFEGEFFVTLQVLVLDLDTREVQYCNAGHIPAIVLDADGETKATLTRTGIPLGVLADRGYEIGKGPRLEPGDVTLLLTDGVVESRSKDGECLWEEGAVEVVQEHIDRPAADIVEGLYQRVRSHSRGRTQDDDVTMVVLKAVDETSAYVRPEQRAQHPRTAMGNIARRVG